MSDVPSQYAEYVDTFRHILNLPDPREPMPRFSTAVMGLDDEKGRQELRPRGPSSMLPLNSVIKDAFVKFDHDFQAANLPEGKYIKAPPSTAKWYKVAQPCYEDKISGVEYRFSKICITPKIAKISSTCNTTLEKCQYSLKSAFKKVKSQTQKGANPEKAAKRGYEQACEYLDIWNRLFLANTELLHAPANPWPIYSRGNYTLWVTPACSGVKPR